MTSLPVFILAYALLPGAVARLDADDTGAQLARSLLASSERRVVAAVRKGDDEVHDIAALARIEQVGADGGVIVSVLERVRVLGLDDSESTPRARIETVTIPAASGVEVEALALEARRLAREIFALRPDAPAPRLDAIKDPGALADFLGHHVPTKGDEKRRLLEILDPVERLKIVVALLARRREVLKAAHDIEGAVQQQVSKAEREPERSVARSWLQWIAEVPWKTQTEDNLDVENARRTLDADHHGLAKVKKRVLQFLAVRALRGDLKGPILCLSGPPGVGKTSLGQSVARAMGRKFV